MESMRLFWAINIDIETGKSPLVSKKLKGFFVYTMSRAQIRACTKICIRRMYIIEPLGEMVYKVYEIG